MSVASGSPGDRDLGWNDRAPNRRKFGQRLLVRVRRRLVYVGLVALMKLLRALPLDGASARFGRFFRWLGPKLHYSNRARHNLELAFPDMAPPERERIVATMWENFACAICEYAHLDTLIREADRRIEIVGAERLDALRDDGKPGLLFSAHFASFNLLTIAARMRSLPISMVYRNPNNVALDAYIRRHQAGNELIDKGARGVRRLVEVMRADSHVLMLVDQKMNEGISVPFFGRPAMTAPGLAQLAYRYDCPVVPIWVERVKGSHFRVFCLSPLELPRSGDRAADVLALMTLVNKAIEDRIRAKPGDWLWLHRRWPKDAAA